MPINASKKANSDLTLTFRVIAPRSVPRVPTPAKCLAFLKRDNWDDWGEYCTQFFLTIFDTDGKEHSIGSVKIGETNLKPSGIRNNLPEGYRKPNIPEHFQKLEDKFFSLGQDDSFYDNLQKLDETIAGIRQMVLSSLRDVAFDKEIWLEVKNEKVMSSSLLRDVTETTVDGQFRRMAKGGARLTPYTFSFRFSTTPKKKKLLKFEVVPDSKPPTNLHVIIGRNGVGKTLILSQNVNSFLELDSTAISSSSEVIDNSPWDFDERDYFANLVMVSFSAFDDVELPNVAEREGAELKFSYIGLRSYNDSDDELELEQLRSPDKDRRLKNIYALTNEFTESLYKCSIGGRKKRWLSALTSLESDPVFRAASLDRLIQLITQKEQQRKQVKNVYNSMSSGHKIVLLTLTRLIESVEEKTLVIMDEPEAHLHPPLLSAFTRALSNLLIDRNGVAVIATHSPVVLQEVPRSCVWILNRTNKIAKAERPRTETFGENLSILSREVFQLELTQSGFHKLLEEAAEKSSSYSEAVDYFGGHLGAEARAILQAIFLSKSI
jgi:ABC-type cobalamin/Fe3+-siderophores transport system ATPase subunit